MDKRIEKMIEEYRESDGIFGYPASEEEIRRAEEMLGVKFPEEYREYIQRYGIGGICGTFLEGIDGNEIPSVVKVTEDYRKYYGLEDNVVVIQDIDEFAMCMRTVDNDKAVYTRYRHVKKLFKSYDSFTDFIIDEFQEGIDNYYY